MKNGSLKAAIISTNLDLCHWKSCNAGINQEYFSRLKNRGEKEEKEKFPGCAGSERPSKSLPGLWPAAAQWGHWPQWPGWCLYSLLNKKNKV